jgi:DNA helicase II / ATP-dependent DNA helicase PcrA
MQSARDQNVILAAAGSRKTERIVESALAATGGRVLITTFTNENQRRIVRRIEQKVGVVPAHISVMGWFSFLISQCAKPYQRAITGVPLVISGLNFKGKRNRFAKKTTLGFYLDSSGAMYRNEVSDFVRVLDDKTNGAVIRRLERVYGHVLIDEVQDLVGYDLDVLERLLKSRISILAVGDLRQAILEANTASRFRKYRGVGLGNWFEERPELCHIETSCLSYRSNQAICDFADALFPEHPKTRSAEVADTGHDGVFVVSRANVHAYIARWPSLTVLRHNKTSDTCNAAATNIGLAKGSTCERVLVFPTNPMLQYLTTRNPAKLKEPERLYVAVTRARFSLAFAIPDDWQWEGTRDGVSRWCPR